MLLRQAASVCGNNKTRVKIKFSADMLVIIVYNYSFNRKVQKKTHEQHYFFAELVKAISCLMSWKLARKINPIFSPALVLEIIASVTLGLTIGALLCVYDSGDYLMNSAAPFVCATSVNSTWGRLTFTRRNTFRALLL